jgi:uncharacterized membrane protein
MIANNRLYLIDILKLAVLIAIAVLHSNEFIFYTHDFPLGAESPLYFAVLHFARCFVIGGQILVATIYFLFGYTGKTKKALLYASLFAVLGQLILSVIFKTLEWDIYSFVGVSSLLIATIPFLYKKNLAVSVFSLLVLFIPTYLFKQYTPDSPFFVVLTGKMTDYNTASWPLLPWFFLSVLFYQAGLYARGNGKLKHLTSIEKIILPVMFLAGIPSLIKYYHVPIGQYYYDFSFNQPPNVFWGNFLMWVIVMRVSLLERVQNKLKDNRLAVMISRLYWLRYLGLSYMLSIIYLGFGMKFADQFYLNPKLFDLFFVVLFVIPEIGSRLEVKLARKIKRPR